MSDESLLPAFAGYGVELEYMIVECDTLQVLPVADALLRDAAGQVRTQVERGAAAWSNELVLHLLELKNPEPVAALEALSTLFQNEVRELARRLAPLGARLMPGAMHPWMDPRRETQLWPHRQADIYAAYDRIFDCRRHGWANLQSLHLNLPFAGDVQFARLHAAIRLLLPLLPALAASSPFAEGSYSGYMDFRMENYCSHESRIPSLLGQVIPDTVSTRAEYEERILSPIYRDIAPHDPAGVLRHEWLNSRGVIPRFERNALEIRVIDMQECPQADLAVAVATVGAARTLYEGHWSPLPAQQAFATARLAQILADCIRDADQALIDDAQYLRLLGYPAERSTARELWHHLTAATRVIHPALREPLDILLQQGPLARRILRSTGGNPTRERLREVYGALCDCLAEGRMYVG